MPKFSILLCNYNYGCYIGEAIDSVLCQRFRDFELIIVDDGSTDHSREVIKSYEDSRIKVVMKENGGQASAFNAGFERSSGDWIVLLDSDDWWELNKLERLQQYISVIGDGYALVQHAIDDWIFGERRPYRNIIPSGDVWAEMQQGGRLDYFVPTTGLAFPRVVADRIFPIPLSFRFSADAFLMRAAVAHGRLFSIPEVLGFHRLHDASFTSNVLKTPGAFIRNILIPELNAYYLKNGCEFQFKPRSRIKESTLKCIRTFIKSG